MLGINDVCVFCREASTGRATDEIRSAYGVSSRILSDSGRFIVVPSVSPLAEGHLLLLPKIHVSSMAQMDAPHLEELFTAMESLYGRLRHLCGSVMMFEHGVGRGKTGGCGVEHAHLHFLPVREGFFGKILGRVGAETGGLKRGMWNALGGMNVDDSYLMLSDDLTDMEYVCSEAIPSQMMRRVAREADGRPDWDWKQYSDPLLFERMLLNRYRWRVPDRAVLASR